MAFAMDGVRLHMEICLEIHSNTKNVEINILPII